ncbi:MAG: hypothetical protein C4539_07855, partial [Ignavibacteriales bacterium]
KWQLMRTSVDDGYYWSMYFVDKDNGWVACDSGRILHTTNGGEDWIQQETFLKDFINSICFVNENVGWACGQNFIFQTDNGGKDWLIQFEDESISNSGKLKGYLKIYFKDKNSGWTVNGSGELLSTTDGGNSWFVKEKWEAAGPTNLSFTNDNGGFILTPNSNLLYTNNGGNNWEKIKIDDIKFQTAIDFIDKNTGWLVTMYGLSSTIEAGSPVYSSTDGGKNWIQSSIIKDDLLDVDFANEKEGWIAGTGKIYSTKNSGLTWSQSDVTGFFVDIFALDNNNVWALDFSGKIYKLMK